jgi:plastocyanin
MRRRALGVALAAATLGCATHKTRVTSGAVRAVVMVRVSDFKFAPAEIVVGARDSIVWVNDDAFAHTSTSDNGTWASPEFTKGGRYALIAPAPGRYAYHCAAHPGMKGVLEVRLEE